MKKLDFETMESIQGGSDYCDIMGKWVSGDSGFQGDFEHMYLKWEEHCSGGKKK